jgi:hypothetical protein
MPACCPECHFEREGREVLPLLPPMVAACLEAEHARLEALGYPLEGVKRHAATEMVFFRVYAPECCAWVEAEHIAVEAALAARDRGEPVLDDEGPEPAPAPARESLPPLIP